MTFIFYCISIIFVSLELFFFHFSGFPIYWQYISYPTSPPHPQRHKTTSNRKLIFGIKAMMYLPITCRWAMNTARHFLELCCSREEVEEVQDCGGGGLLDSCCLFYMFVAFYLQHPLHSLAIHPHPLLFPTFIHIFPFIIIIVLFCFFLSSFFLSSSCHFFFGFHWRAIRSVLSYFILRPLCPQCGGWIGAVVGREKNGEKHHPTCKKIKK